MPLEHVSNVNAWGGHPDRNYYIFIAISIVFGFLGLDHFYLRSFETGVKKFIVNIFGLGIWYFWDILQIVSDGKAIREEGLSSPLDWIKGIGRGTFVEPTLLKKVQMGGSRDSQSQEPTNEQPVFSARKSYLLYAFLAIFFGWLGLDKFYMGAFGQGFVKLISCFNIFLFLFGWVWVLWDSFHAFFMTESVLQNGITVPLPYSFIFEDIPTQDFKVTQSGGQESFFADWTPNLLWFLPAVPRFEWVTQLYKDIAAPLLTVPVVKALQAIPSSKDLTGMASGSLGTLPQMPEMPSIPKIPSVSVPSVKETETKEDVKPAAVMKGGARNEPITGPGPVIAGALSAIVLAGGLKGFYDVIAAQYG